MKKKWRTHSFEGMQLLKYHENSELFKLFVEKQVAKIWIAKECVYIMST